MMSIKELAIKKIQSLGVQIYHDDDIDFYLESAEAVLKLELLEETLPDGIEFLWAEFAAGLYLKDNLVKNEKSEGALVYIKEGNITFEYEKGESVFGTAQKMCELTEYKLAPFRRIQW